MPLSSQDLDLLRSDLSSHPNCRHITSTSTSSSWVNGESSVTEAVKVIRRCKGGEGDGVVIDRVMERKGEDAEGSKGRGEDLDEFRKVVERAWGRDEAGGLGRGLFGGGLFGLPVFEVREVDGEGEGMPERRKQQRKFRYAPDSKT